MLTDLSHGSTAITICLYSITHIAYCTIINQPTLQPHLITARIRPGGPSDSDLLPCTRTFTPTIFRRQLGTTLPGSFLFTLCLYCERTLQAGPAALPLYRGVGRHCEWVQLKRIDSFSQRMCLQVIGTPQKTFSTDHLCFTRSPGPGSSRKSLFLRKSRTRPYNREFGFQSVSREN